MNFLDTFRTMLVILFTLGAGCLGNHLGYLGGEVDSRLSKLALNITMPAMIIGAVLTGDELPEASVILSVLGVGIVFYGLEFLFALAVPRLLGGTPGQMGIWRYTLVFNNLAFVGYPVVLSLFGQEALFYAVILAIPFNLLNYTIGPLLLVGAKRFQWKQLLSPCVLAAVLGLALAFTRIRTPALVGEMFAMVGDMSIPLCLMLVGSLLTGLSVRDVLASPRMWILTAIRLLALPAALYPLLLALGFQGVVMQVGVIQMAMPAAMNGALLCMEYGGDTECMAQVTFVTTLAAMVTIPCVSLLL
ncbi:MAG: hypothetical protein HFF84_04455 [Oscillibacter sp.]|nr:hypothetical protein [Oscillibacter sp.]